MAREGPESDPAHRYRHHAAEGLARPLCHLHYIGERPQRLPRQVLCSPWEGARFIQREIAGEAQEYWKYNRSAWMDCDKGFGRVYLLREQRRCAQLLSRYQDWTDLSKLCLLVRYSFAQNRTAEQAGGLKCLPRGWFRAGVSVSRRNLVAKNSQKKRSIRAFRRAMEKLGRAGDLI